MQEGSHADRCIGRRTLPFSPIGPLGFQPSCTLGRTRRGERKSARAKRRICAEPALLPRHFQRRALADVGGAGADHDVELAGLDHAFHVAVPESEISGAELELDSL